MPFPSPPWQLRATFWLSVFAVSSGTSERGPGLYGAAFVDYAPGGDLSYRELLVSRLVADGPVPTVTVTDIWVDSPESLEGGRALWAIPKSRASFDLDAGGRSLRRVTASAADEGGTPLAVATGRALTAATPRVPLVLDVRQHRRDGRPVVARARGRGRVAPARVRWDFGDGPLAWLGGRVPVVSVRLSDVDLAVH